jgi:hypothetical protein
MICHTITERELLSAIEICKEYKDILLGYPIIVFTDLWNITFNGVKASDRIFRTFIIGSVNRDISIRNIKITIPIHNSLIFKEQAKVKATGLREEALAQPSYSMQHIEGYDLLCYKEYKQDLHSSIIETNNKECCPDTMNFYFIQDKQ